MTIKINIKGDYFAAFLFGWAAITAFLVYCFVWDLHFLTAAIGLLCISALTKKAEDWSKEKEEKPKSFRGREVG